MTTEEGLNCLLNERGFVVYAINHSHNIGDVVYGHAYGEIINHPFYIVAESTREEFERSSGRLSELTGRPATGYSGWTHYYRAATD